MCDVADYVFCRCSSFSSIITLDKGALVLQLVRLHYCVSCFCALLGRSQTTKIDKKHRFS